MKRLMRLVCVLPIVLSACTSARREDPDLARGREQLVRAFDAAYVRVVASGTYREILGRHPASNPGAARSYMVTMADCLPAPDLVLFPEKPVGLLREILARGEIRRGTQLTSATPGDTSTYFSPISDEILKAMLAEMERHYDVKLKLTDVALKPPSNETTSLLLDGRADFIDQLNATGGDTQGLRRRISRRFTCTISAVSQFIHVPTSSPLAASLNDSYDLFANKTMRICTGPLSTQTMRAFFPGNKVTTRYMQDITNCVKDVEAGKSDVIANPLPDLAIAGVPGYKGVHTLLVTGTPLWVAKEGIACPSDGDPNTEDKCFEK
jgi:ABC-type amino acid transport substrate-binding protein